MPVPLQLLLSPGEPARAAVAGCSVLSALGLPCARTGAAGLFDSADAWLSEAPDATAVYLSPSQPAAAAPTLCLPLGRQHALWRAIPEVQQRLGLTLDTQRHVKTAAVVIVVDGAGAVLLTRRAASMRSYPGCWVLPGGAVDAGESLACAAAREVFEETGLPVSLDTLSAVACWESAFPLCAAGYEAARKLTVHTLMVAYVAHVEPVAPPLRLQEAEVDVACWVSPSRLEELLQGSLSEAQPAAAHGGEAQADGGMRDQVRAEQLCGVYPNGLNPPEGLGLAHHFVLGCWLAARRAELSG